MSDEMAAAVVNELQKRGRRVPEDVSVLGFDNTSTALHVHPPLSTMAQPLEEMGRMAVKKLLRSRDLGPGSCRTNSSNAAPPPRRPRAEARPTDLTPTQQNPHPGNSRHFRVPPSSYSPAPKTSHPNRQEPQ